MKKIIVLLSALLLISGPVFGQGKNKIWVGKLQKLDFQAPKGEDPFIQLVIAEDRTAAAFGTYDIQKTIAVKTASPYED